MEIWRVEILSSTPTVRIPFALFCMYCCQFTHHVTHSMCTHIRVHEQPASSNAWAQGWCTTGAPSVMHPSHLPSPMFKDCWSPPILLLLMDFSNIRNMCCMGSMTHHVHICRVPGIYGKCRHKHIGGSQQFLSGVPQNPALVHI